MFCPCFLCRKNHFTAVFLQSFFWIQILLRNPATELLVISVQLKFCCSVLKFEKAVFLK